MRTRLRVSLPQRMSIHRQADAFLMRRLLRVQHVRRIERESTRHACFPTSGYRAAWLAVQGRHFEMSERLQ